MSDTFVKAVTRERAVIRTFAAFACSAVAIGWLCALVRANAGG